MLEAIRYQFAHLADFTGRDGRSTFWYWVLALVIVDFVTGIILSIPMAASTMGTAIHAARSGASEGEVRSRVMENMSAGLGTTLYLSLAVTLILTLLLFAPFVRRLHDTERSGWWAAVPGATQLFAIYHSIRAASALSAVMREGVTQGNVQALQGLSPFDTLGLVPWIGYLVVIVFGVMQSQPRPNRYGEAPVRF